MSEDDEEKKDLRYRIFKLSEVLYFISKGFDQKLRPDDYRNVEISFNKYGDLSEGTKDQMHEL